MQVYHIPKQCEVLLFDIDMTLYYNPEYFRSQIENQIRLLSQEWFWSFEKTEEKIEAFRQQWLEEKGEKLSFGNTLLYGFGVPISRSVELRDQCITPEDYLKSDPRLKKVLKELHKRYRLVALTNNTSRVGLRTLEVLGVSDLFELVIGLDMTGHSKPHPAVYDYVLEKVKAAPGLITSIGDRYQVDLKKPLDLGMGGVLVNGMEDVYKLPQLLLESH
jgi:HAD superfamily hydrolase (TIGR01549 family)